MQRHGGAPLHDRLGESIAFITTHYFDKAAQEPEHIKKPFECKNSRTSVCRECYPIFDVIDSLGFGQIGQGMGQQCFHKMQLFEMILAGIIGDVLSYLIIRELERRGKGKEKDSKQAGEES